MMANHDGPAIAALVPDGAAEFIADPRSGGAVVVHRDGAEPKAAVGRWSVAQQRDQLAVLRALEETLGVASQTKVQTDAADTSETADKAVGSPVPKHPAVSAQPFVSGASPRGTNDEQLTGAIAGWLLAEAGFVNGATR